MQTPKSFIGKVLKEVLSETVSVSDIVFVLPSKRACFFLQQELSLQLKETSFAPKIYNIESFVETISELEIINHTQLLFEFYEAYKETNPLESIETIESVVSWSSPLLSDFNEIDAHLVDTYDFFSYLSNVKEVEHWYLQEERTPLIQEYISFWKSLPQLYDTFAKRLLNRGLAYQGLVYREAIDTLEHYIEANTNKYHVFLGFNALNVAEQKLFQSLLERNLATVYWDADVYFMNDTTHSASSFMRSYKEKWKHYKTNPFQYVDSNYNSFKNVEIIGASGQIGQVKAVGNLLEKMPLETLRNTAVVLGDENLLIPMLHALPKGIGAVNITMGVSLKQMPGTYFFQKLLNLHSQYNGRYYYKDVLDILQHPLANILCDTTDVLVQKIQEGNKAYLHYSDINHILGAENASIVELLFKPWESKLAIEKLKSILFQIAENTSETKEILLVETLSKLLVVINQLQRLNERYQQLLSIQAIQHFFEEIIEQTTLDFQGEPYTGLQIMGVLETRAIDYENVIITSLNEGTLPAGKTGQSFIPYDLKKAFGLPTFNERDAIYSYHFYRLLHRAKSIHLLYDNQADGLKAGEQSRFLMQLKLQSLSAHQIKEIAISESFNLTTKKLKTIPKTPEVIEAIKAVLKRGISPSALVIYIRNPIDFYYRYVLNIKETEGLEETIEANTLGSILHDVLEELYTPFLGKELTASDVSEMSQRVDALTQQMFSVYYKGGVIDSGKNLIIFEVAKRYIELFLNAEKKTLKAGTSIVVKQLEQKVLAPFDIPELPFEINLQGTVDRIDVRNGILHIIDYKTGVVEPRDLKLKDMESLLQDYKYSKAFQVLMYSMLWFHNNSVEQCKAGVFSFKRLKDEFIPFVFEGESLLSQSVITSFSDKLKQLIMELCNPEIPFVEKEV